MLNSLYIEATKKRGKLNQIPFDIDDESSISNFWDEIVISPSNKQFSLAAGDGSFNKKKFLASNFYAVVSESLIFKGDLKKIEEAVVDEMEHHPFIDDLLRTYMGILELKTAVKSFENFDVDYYLYDGSLLGDLIRPLPIGANISKLKKQDILDNTLTELKERLEYFNFKIQSQKIIDRYYKNYHEKFEYMMFLSSIEKLLILKDLLRYKDKIIAISKTSTNRDLFKSNIPDISIFDKYTHKSGISKIIYKKVSLEVKNKFPIDDEFFRQLEFTIFYLRLEDYKNVLKIELPYRASRNEVLSIIKKLKKYSTEGYPYLLKKAHKDVVISEKDIKELATIVNINEKIGREMLR